MIKRGEVEVECEHCNQEIPDDVQICVNCGSDISYQEKA